MWAEQAHAVLDSMLPRVTRPELKTEIADRFKAGVDLHVKQEREIAQERRLSGFTGGRPPDTTPAAAWAQAELRTIATNLKKEGKM